MSVATIVQTIDVKAVPARAFELFTERMSDWWPKGRTPGANPHVALVIEPHVGGRWYERDADGHDTQWGTVLAWEPPGRLVLGWQLDQRFTYDPALVTEVELRFEAAPGGGTRVTLEHRDLERFGSDWETMAAKIRSGWPERMRDFMQFVADHS